MASLVLANYPFLADAEFKLVCEAFVSSFQKRKTAQKEWESVALRTLDNQNYVRIVKLLRVEVSEISVEAARDEDAQDERSTDDFEEIDEEALPRSIDRISEKDSNFTIEYDILLSPSYCVPILHFSLRDATSRKVTDIDQVYGLIVPEVYRNQIREVGVMGGLSMANHPITDIPAFFIHPCQTAEALQEVAGGRNVSTEEYLLLWMGVIGPSVGLQAPLSMGEQKK